MSALAAPARILIVDDEVANREVLAIILGLEGYVVVNACSGAEALLRAEQDAPDLILLDLMMPEMNGYQVATAMKANQATRHIGLIMVTALTDSATRNASLAAGADDFLTKPLNRAELCAHVKTLLAHKRAGDVASSDLAE